MFTLSGGSRGAAIVRQTKRLEMNDIASEECKTKQIHLTAMLS